MSDTALTTEPDWDLVITPKARWFDLHLGDLWRYRDLLWFLTLRDVKVKYKQTLLGIAWAVIVPFSNMVIFGTVFGKIA